MNGLTHKVYNVRSFELKWTAKILLQHLFCSDKHLWGKYERMQRVKEMQGVPSLSVLLLWVVGGFVDAMRQNACSCWLQLLKQDYCIRLK